MSQYLIIFFPVVVELYGYVQGCSNFNDDTLELPQSCALAMWLTCPSIMYDNMNTWSVAMSGNFKGSLVVSMSNANTIGSCQENRGTRVGGFWTVPGFYRGIYR